MRDYGKVTPQFWTGSTGKALKAAGPEAVIVAIYLMTSPHANMIGLYYLPTLYLAHETGLGIEGASKGLARCIEAGFCLYDEASEHVLVPAMARFQIGEALKPTDLRCKGIENELAKAPKGALQQRFREIYAESFHLVPASPLEAPSKPRAGAGAGAGAGAEPPATPPSPQKRKKPATSLPADFGISDRVKDWAKQKGFDRLPEHLEAFKGKAKAKGYTYVDWDAAFMEAIREDWAKVRSGNVMPLPLAANQPARRYQEL